MPKKDEADYVVSETGNWNVADQYTKNKIMRPLNRCDYYEDIAYFGYESIVDELGNYQVPPNDLVKIKATKRLIMELIRVIDNSKFALKKGKTRKTALDYKENLKKLHSVLPNLIHISRNRVAGTSSVSIKNFTLFEEILNKISEIKSKINEPLNANHLIFVDKEEFDPRKFKQTKKDRMINQG